MAVKKKKHKRVEDMSEKDWSEWGRSFGKRMKKRGAAFAEEMEGLGERFEQRFEKRRDRPRGWNRAFWSFGVIGPFFAGIFGIAILALALIILGWLNIVLGSSFISALISFLFSNLGWIFLAGLFFGYAKFFLAKVRRNVGARSAFRPIVSSAGITFAAWILAGVLMAANVSARNGFVFSVSSFLSDNLVGIFIVFLAIGYAIELIRVLSKSVWLDWD